MTKQESKLEYLSGNVERVTYHNEENGFAVLKVKVKGHKDLVAVIGTVPSITPGEDITSKGYWQNNVQYGLGFKAEFIQSIPPTTIEGIERYLGSGLIKGIGPHFAKKLVAAFSEDIFDIIESSPIRLKEVEGIGDKRIEKITKNWQEQKIVREIMVFLQSNGVGTTRATRIYKTYGDQSIALVKENPYRLAKDIRGIGFLSADKIAKNLGIEENSIIRARAGISFTLMQALSDGHVALPIDLLLSNAEKLLSINKSILEEALNLELKEEFLTKDQINKKDFIFLTGYYNYQKNIATKLLTLEKEKVPWDEIATQKAIQWVEEKQNIKLAINQKNAITQAITNKVLVLTGGPGTGKTTILNCIIKILSAKKVKIKLCAPTGRAAKKMSEATGREALTIHRLLQFEPHIGDFKYNEDNQLDCNLLIIDESSMVDVPLMHSLLKAVNEKTALLIVGDVDQLPSVGAGQVLKDIIDSQKIKIVKLTEIYRQEESSDIVTNAHLINEGRVPILKPKGDEKDFYFVEANEAEDIANMVKLLVKERIPKKFKFNPIRDIQVLCPMQRSGCGARYFNIELQKILNPEYLAGVEKFGQRYARGDKVMQIENNYDKEVYNGDIGYVSRVDNEEQEVYINFDDKEVTYSFTELDEITLAYATTIHKSQGSEYPAVVMPISMQHYVMLKKNLLYTAVTRGKKLVILYSGLKKSDNKKSSFIS
ncbi:SF1B family DNA helicase RecD2 [Candidatus Bandiella numerosa]|uniref:SF1B family DNA helicase RecD2 n=1 Tax=Candidatus Bandiella numerosa TaxID=2570586 RepID=UPI001F01FF9C|nr:ATP-dependent RecD-like DNA helicase [Candidatus Bandiella numerosa]